MSTFSASTRVRRRAGWRPRTLAMLVCAAAAPAAAAETPAARTPPTIAVDADGTVHADGLAVPLSEYLSPQAKAAMAARLSAKPAAPADPDPIKAARAGSEAFLKVAVAKWQALGPTQIRSEVMNGVRTDVITPQGGVAPENKNRVLINLHGGGFFTGAGAGGQAESIPLAARGRITVVAVDYRLAPEAKFPAASQDVEQVYRKLLETYKPANIGIYGCSAGGTLVAMSLAWFQQHDLPRPGAAGVFCSGALPGFWYGGDSMSVGQMMNARVAATPAQRRATEIASNTYLSGVDQNDPLVAPALFPATLAKFPPTLVLASTRDTALSNALVTNAKLLEAGVETQLFVVEGIGHGEFVTLPGTPEATQSYNVIWRFFDTHLGK